MFSLLVVASLPAYQAWFETSVKFCSSCIQDSGLKVSRLI